MSYPRSIQIRPGSGWGRTTSSWSLWLSSSLPSSPWPSSASPPLWRCAEVWTAWGQLQPL